MDRRAFIGRISGGLLAWPLAARAQQPPMPVVGYLSGGSPEADMSRTSAFVQGLNETGYVEGQNVVIEYRWARGENDRLRTLAADLVGRRVSVIATVGLPPAVAAKAATTTVPIVFNVGDPIEFGLVATLSRPGGNLTGVATMNTELAGKRLNLLHELLPKAAVIAGLVNPTNRIASESEETRLRDAARLLGLNLHLLPASTPSEIDAAFGNFIQFRADGLVVAGDPFLTNRKDQIVALAASHALPAIYIWREFVAAGGLMSYGTDLADSYRQAGVLTGKILRGTRPGDLPVQQATKLGLVINLKTAKALGLTIPQSLLLRADEVIQ